jgi:hypothetical protein
MDKLRIVSEINLPLKSIDWKSFEINELLDVLEEIQNKMISCEDWNQLQFQIHRFNGNDKEIELDEIPNLTFNELRISRDLSTIAIIEEGDFGNEIFQFIVYGISSDECNKHKIQKQVKISHKKRKDKEESDDDPEEMKFL